MTKGGKIVWTRIRHHTASAAAWVLVLLALGVARLWVDVGHVTDVFFRQASRDSHTVRDVDLVSGSQVLLLRFTWFLERPANFDRFRGGWRCAREGLRGVPGQLVLYQRQQSWSHFGFTRWTRAGRAPKGDPDTIIYTLMFPHWFVLLLLFSWPAKRGWGWLILRRRKRMGLCLNCGYDLRESPERCPECGAARGGNAEIRNSNDERMPKRE